MTIAADVLNDLILQDTREPMSRSEADELAGQWYAFAADNGTGAEEMDAAAGMPLANYILKTFGDSGQEVHV